MRMSPTGCALSLKSSIMVTPVRLEGASEIQELLNVLSRKQGFEPGPKSSINVHARLSRAVSVQNHSNGGGILRLQQVRRKLGNGHGISQPRGTSQRVLGRVDECVQPRPPASEDQAGAEQFVYAGLTELVAQQLHQLARTRFEDFPQHALLHQSGGPIADGGHLDLIAPRNASDDGTAKHLLDAFGVGNGCAEADSYVVGEMVAANGNGY